MAYSLRTITIAGALLVSVGLITTAFYISGTSRQVSAQDAEELLRAYASKDSDSDGLPDWQEKLYDTDPLNATSVDPSMTDSEAVEAGLVKPRFESEELPTSSVPVASVPGVAAAPGTVTDQFARIFFQQYLEMRGAQPPTTESLLAFIEDAVADLSLTNQIPRVYTSADVRVSGSGADAMRTYMNAATTAFIRDGSADKDAMFYFGKVVYNEDKAALQELKELGRAYEEIGAATIRVSAPQELAGVHLRFANSLALMGVIINDLTAVNDDPLRAFLVLGQYQTAAKEMTDSLLAIGRIYDAAGISIDSSQQGYVLYALTQRLERASEVLKDQTP